MAEFFTAPIAGFLRGWRKARDRHRGVTGATASVAPAPGAGPAPAPGAGPAPDEKNYHRFFGKKWYEMAIEDRTRWTTLGWPSQQQQQQQVVFRATCPPGATPGTVVQVQGPAGAVRITIPEGCDPGTQFQFQVPAPEVNAAEAWDTNDTRWGLRGAKQKKFEALSPAQKQAAQALGYTRVTFNDPSSWKGGFISTDTARFEAMSWVDIPIRERAHWHMLGWDERAWDTDEDEFAPPSSNKYFRELNRAEKEAALALGYTPAAWDAEDV